MYQDFCPNILLFLKFKKWNTVYDCISNTQSGKAPERRTDYFVNVLHGKTVVANYHPIKYYRFVMSIMFEVKAYYNSKRLSRVIINSDVQLFFSLGSNMNVIDKLNK